VPAGEEIDRSGGGGENVIQVQARVSTHKPPPGR
jgi:hypothetical protein